MRQASMDNVLEDLSKKIVTKEDLNFLLEEINLLEQFIFKNADTPLSERAKGKLKSGFIIYLEKLERDGLIPKSLSQQLAFWEEIKKFIQEIPQVKLEVAFDPSEDFLLKIKKWLREETHKELILDLTINRLIAGGSIIEYQGQYRNFSLAKKIDELIAQKNHE